MKTLTKKTTTMTGCRIMSLWMLALVGLLVLAPLPSVSSFSGTSSTSTTTVLFNTRGIPYPASRYTVFNMLEKTTQEDVMNILGCKFCVVLLAAILHAPTLE